MDSADANAAKLILATLDEPGWKEDLPRLVVGAASARQKRGTAHHHGQPVGLARARQVRGEVQAEKVGRRSTASTGAAPQALDWSARPRAGVSRCPGRRPGHARRCSTKAPASLADGAGLAAIPLAAPLRAGYAINRSVSAVEQKEKGRWSRGDVMRCGWRSSRSPT